jgi:predicted RNA-binding protein with EMAP domain
LIQVLDYSYLDVEEILPAVERVLPDEKVVPDVKGVLGLFMESLWSISKLL